MSAPTAVKFYLTGPHEGKDITLSGCKFEKGVHTVHNPAEASAVGNLLITFYSCMTEGDFHAHKAEQEKAEAERVRAEEQAAKQRVIADEKAAADKAAADKVKADAKAKAEADKAAKNQPAAQ